MAIHTTKSKAQFLQEIVHRYRAVGEKWPATTITIASWAIKHGLWQPQTRNVLKQCAKEIASALRQEYYTDPQNRRVRKKHAFKDGETQLTFWVDIEDAAPAQMRKAFAWRRASIFCDCKQLKTDVDSYNDNNKHGAQLAFDFDFNEDLAEAALPAEYPAPG